MKKLMVALPLAALALGTAAETYTWTGGVTTSGDWGNPANWSSAGGTAGVPGGGDTAKIADAVTFVSDIAIASGELKVANSAAVTIGGVISGAGSLRADSTATLTLSGANTFTGGAYVNGPVRLSSATALGILSEPVNHRTGTLYFACENAVYPYDIRPVQCANYTYRVEATGTLDGSIQNDNVDYFNTSFFVDVSGASFTVNGSIRVKDNAYGTLEIRPRGGSADFSVLGGVSAYHIYGDKTGDGYSTAWRNLKGDSSIRKITLAYTKGFRCLSENVLSSATLLNFTAYTDNDKACVDLNGFDQTANRLVTETPASWNAKAWWINSAKEATFTLEPSQDSLVNYAYIGGAVTLVMNAADSSYVQAFQGRASETTGDLVASNGVIRIADGASFPNVRNVRIASGGAVEVRTGAVAAFASLRTVSVAAGGRLAVDDAAAQAFPLGTVALDVETGATIDLGENVVLSVASLTVDGKPAKSGSYVFGKGVVKVPQPVSPDATGVWTGQGESESTMDFANWEGGYPGKIPLTFATGGTRAKLVDDLSAASVTFALPDAAEGFTITTDESAPNATLHVAGNVSMTEGAVPHTATVSAPLSLDAATVELAVAGAGNTLVVDGPIAQGVASVALTKTGAGTLRLNGSGSTFATGSLQVNQGAFYVKGGALGGTESSPLPVTVSMPDKVSPIRLDGGVFNQKFTIVTAQNGVNVHANEGTTNVIRGSVTVQHNNSMYFRLEANSSTAFDGGYFGNWVYQYQPTIELYEGASLYITNKAYQAGTGNSAEAFIRSRSVGRPSSDQRVYLGGKGSAAPNGLILAGPMTVTFTEDFAFTNSDTAADTPLRMMNINKDPEYVKPIVIDLNGHSQGFGGLMTRPSDQPEYGYLNSWGDSGYSYFTSATPATLYVRQNGRPNDLPWKPTFRGVVSLVKSGTNTLTLAGVSSTSGRLEVADGRLDFSDKGAWTNVSEVAVSGGVLAITDKGQVKKRADYYLSGGKLDIAAGVRLTAENLYVADGQGDWIKMDPGTYTAANLPDFISGEGSLFVRGGGLTLIVR